MNVYQYLTKTITEKGAAFLVLIDPDKIALNDIPDFVKNCEKSGVDALLVGGSLIFKSDLLETIKAVKENCSLPVIIFPGSVENVLSEADALLFISLISSRNAELLIGRHVLAAPIIKKHNLETISTGYMLIEGGNYSTSEYMSFSKPIPRNKFEIAAATSLAAEYLGMKMIYLEAGSGARFSVPEKMIKMVSNNCNLPIMVGGGIKNPKEAGDKVKAGAKLVVIGNHFEDKANGKFLNKFARAIHIKQMKKKEREKHG